MIDKEAQDLQDASDVASLAKRQAIASFDPNLGTPIECWIDRKVKSALSNLARAKDREQAFWRKLRKRSGKGSKHDPEAINRDLVQAAELQRRHDDLCLDTRSALEKLRRYNGAILSGAALVLAGASIREASERAGCDRDKLSTLLREALEPVFRGMFPESPPK